ncbi:MAG: radical SAM protein [Candidatus Levybacteria bacterium]|nr:radical SAM protein [Candidatus Levybacteria bacterium]
MSKEFNPVTQGLLDIQHSPQLFPSTHIENVPPKDLYKTLSAPLDVQVEVTTLCNEACVHCYNFWRGAKFKGVANNLPDTTLGKDKVLVIMDQLVKSQVFRVTFTGGEPFLFRDAVTEGVRFAKKAGLDCSLNSNLTVITRKDAESLKEAGLDSVLTSLHSFDEETHDEITQRRGSFGRTLRGIKICRDAGLDVGVNMVVMQTNQEQVFETGKFVKELGVRSFSATKAAPCLGGTNFSEVGIDKNAFKKMIADLILLEKTFGINVDTLMAYPLCALGDVDRFKKFAQHSCGAGITTCTIGSRGDVRPCSFSDETYGNIFSDSLPQIWKGMKDWRDGSRLPKNCVDNCKYFSQCGGGCRMEAKFAGDKVGMDPLATGPLDVVSLPVSDLNPSPSDFWERRLIVTPNLRLRRENFGGIIAPQGRQPVLVDSAAYEIIDRLKNSSSPFSFKGIEPDFNLSQASSDFFFALFTKEFFREVQ